jgi:hypothetical protein
MDNHRSPEPLTDATLEREIEALVAVKPSPEFVARVRMQLANEPAPSFGLLPAVTCTAVGVVAALLVSVLLSRGGKTNIESTGLPQIAANPIHDAWPSVLHGGAATRGELLSSAFKEVSRPQQIRSEPRVLVAPDEVQALQRFLTGFHTVRIDPSTFEETRSAEVALEEPLAVAIAPLTIDPLVPAGAGEGEAQ